MMIAILILITLLINAFAIVGFHLATEKGMILHFIREWCVMLPESIQKPLYDCPTCMASLHSIYVYWLAYFILNDTQYIPFQWAFMVYPVYILALAGLATIVNNKVQE